MDIKKLLNKYIKDNLAEESFLKQKFSFRACGCACQEDLDYSSIDDYINNNKDESKFQKLLFKYIDERALKDSDVYNKVNIDRRLFSKIRSDENYHPSKETVILLSLALKLNEDEMLDLLESASYSLPKNNVFDLIIRFCFINEIYEVNDVNELLFEHNQKVLNN